MYTFTKEERLSSLKLIKALFDNGSSFLLYPYRIIYLPAPVLQKHPLTVLISVPKKKFSRAVDRNRIKRLIKEAFRLNKKEHFYPLLPKTQNGLLLVIQYIAPEILSQEILESKLKSVFLKLKTEDEKNFG